MTPERYRQIEAVLEVVMDLPPAERSARASALCGDDEPLLTEVLSLLAYEGDGETWRKPAFPLDRLTPPEPIDAPR